MTAARQVMTSSYMHWAKTSSTAKFNLATSGMPNLSIRDLRVSLDDLEIEFVVFSPQTAKVVINGRSYLNVNRKGPIIVGPTSRGPTGALYREELIRRAGEDAGERILKALRLDVPVIR